MTLGTGLLVQVCKNQCRVNAKRCPWQRVHVRPFRYLKHWIWPQFWERQIIKKINVSKEAVCEFLLSTFQQIKLYIIIRSITYVYTDLFYHKEYQSI